MPNPKKRHSSCKRGQRRSHDALTATGVSTCPQCGESYYAAEALQYLERVREDFARRVITPASIGKVYQVS